MKSIIVGLEAIAAAADKGSEMPKAEETIKAAKILIQELKKKSANADEVIAGLKDRGAIDAKDVQYKDGEMIQFELKKPDQLDESAGELRRLDQVRSVLGHQVHALIIRSADRDDQASVVGELVGQRRRDARGARRDQDAVKRSVVGQAERAVCDVKRDTPKTQIGQGLRCVSRQ